MQALSSNNCQILLKLAHDSIRSHLEGNSLPELKLQGPELLQKAGCFVTLRICGQLRGCVGTFDGSKTLYENVRRMACSAAFQDVRFTPLEISHLKDIYVEISVLTDPVKVSGIQDVEAGRHGVLIKYQEKSGTLLPHVALEFGWSSEEFVMSCAREKAGLTPVECMAAEIFVYEVHKFSDK